MSAVSPVLRSVADGCVAIWCPGCDESHVLRVRVEGGRRPSWVFDGNADRPTFEPSLLVTYNGTDAGELDADGFRAPPAVCHSFIRDGQIQFLGDCTHALAGQTVPLPAWPEAKE